MKLEVALLEWPDGPENGGPRLLGRLSDPILVKTVRERLAAIRRRELGRLEGRRLRSVPSSAEDESLID